MYFFGPGSAGLVPAAPSAVFCLMADHTFRLKNTPLGDLVVKFYQIEPYSPRAFELALQRDFLVTSIPGSGGSWGTLLNQGMVDDVTVEPWDVFLLHMQCTHCNCVRVERGI